MNSELVAYCLLYIFFIFIFLNTVLFTNSLIVN
jgi:hypothetical protein